MVLEVPLVDSAQKIAFLAKLLSVRAITVHGFALDSSGVGVDRSPVAGKFLRALNLLGRHLTGDSLPIFRCLLIAVRCREIEPHVGLYQITVHTVAGHIHGSQAVLRGRKTLFGSLSVPGCRQRQVSLDTLGIGNAQIKLGVTVALGGRFLPEGDRRTVVCRHALAKPLCAPGSPCCAAFWNQESASV